MQDFVAIDFETANGRRSSGCCASRRCLDKPSHQLHLSAAACGYDMENHHHALCYAEACAAIALKLL